MSYQIYIRVQKEPLEITSSQAEKAVAIFNDSGTKSDHVINIGSSSFKKGEIRMIREGTGEANDFKRPHWIIKNEKRGLIWKQAYTTFEDARNELDYQEKILGNKNHGFMIESHNSDYKVLTKLHTKSLEEMSKTLQDRNFDDLIASAQSKLQ
jgi:hypothetical protein